MQDRASNRQAATLDRFDQFAGAEQRSGVGECHSPLPISPGPSRRNGGKQERSKRVCLLKSRNYNFEEAFVHHKDRLWRHSAESPRRTASWPTITRYSEARRSQAFARGGPRIKAGMWFGINRIPFSPLDQGFEAKARESGLISRATIRVLLPGHGVERGKRVG